MSGIRAVAGGLVEEFKRLLSGQRKTQRDDLALLVATMREVRSADLMDLAAALPRAANRTDMRCQRIARVLADDLIDPGAVMAPFAAEAPARAAAERCGTALIKETSRSRIKNMAVQHTCAEQLVGSSDDTEMSRPYFRSTNRIVSDVTHRHSTPKP